MMVQRGSSCPSRPLFLLAVLVLRNVAVVRQRSFVVSGFPILASSTTPTLASTDSWRIQQYSSSLSPSTLSYPFSISQPILEYPSTTALYQADTTDQLSFRLDDLIRSAISGARQTGTQVQQQVSLVTHKVIRKHWWSWPLTLCLVPLITFLCWQTTPSTPTWWKLVNVRDTFLSHTYGELLQTIFLASNVSYLLAGLYLWYKFPPLSRPLVRYDDKPQQRSRTKKDTTNNKNSTNKNLSASRVSMILAALVHNNPLGRIALSQQFFLGAWVLLAGLVSTIFHSVQTLGDYAIAEGWCYLDHGVAISAILYFFRICGRPNKIVWTLGGTGLVALSIPNGYAWLHSVWHVLSAAAAVVWGLQQKAERREQLERCVRFAVFPKRRQDSADS